MKAYVFAREGGSVEGPHQHPKAVWWLLQKLGPARTLKPASCAKMGQVTVSMVTIYRHDQMVWLGWFIGSLV